MAKLLNICNELHKSITLQNNVYGITRCISTDRKYGIRRRDYENDTNFYEITSSPIFTEEFNTTFKDGDYNGTALSEHQKDIINSQIKHIVEFLISNGFMTDREDALRQIFETFRKTLQSQSTIYKDIYQWFRRDNRIESYNLITSKTNFANTNIIPYIFGNPESLSWDFVRRESDSSVVLYVLILTNSNQSHPLELVVNNISIEYRTVVTFHVSEHNIEIHLLDVGDKEVVEILYQIYLPAFEFLRGKEGDILFG